MVPDQAPGVSGGGGLQPPSAPPCLRHCYSYVVTTVVPMHALTRNLGIGYTKEHSFICYRRRPAVLV